MHHIQAAYEHRWTAPGALVVGLAVLAFGMTRHGDSNPLITGMLLTIVASNEWRDRTRILRSDAEAHRIGFRRGCKHAAARRGVRPGQPAALYVVPEDRAVASK
jgi:hypothetical protein